MLNQNKLHSSFIHLGNMENSDTFHEGFFQLWSISHHCLHAHFNQNDILDDDTRVILELCWIFETRLTVSCAYSDGVAGSSLGSIWHIRVVDKMILLTLLTSWWDCVLHPSEVVTFWHWTASSWYKIALKSTCHKNARLHKFHILLYK